MSRFLLNVLLFGLLVGCRFLPTADSTPIPPLVTEPPPAAAADSLTAVSQTNIPPSDFATLASQFGGGDPIRLAHTEPVAYQVGDTAPFWVTNFETGTNRQIDAVLSYRSNALNLWLEQGERVSEATFAAAAARIEQQILPTNRAFFGQEWQPGIDGDLRVNVLHATDMGDSVAAAFSQADEYVQAVNPFSNERELLYVNLDAVAVNSDPYFAAIAHELQHLIQWYTDSNEDLWLNEGLAELAVHLNGLPTERESAYVAQTDLQLTALSQEPEVAEGHYAAAFLFAAYFFDRFGEAATQALVQDGENGRLGVDTILAQQDPTLTFDTVFADWLVANYLHSIGRGSSIHQYQTIDLPPLRPRSVGRLPAHIDASVNQYGADYWHIESEAPVQLQFVGSRQVPLLPTTPHSGDYLWAALFGDGSNMSLTRRFDLAGLETATLTFWSWYEIEEGWDYGYVALSVDNGRFWQLLRSESSTDSNPQGNSFGPGYTGSSGGWVQQTVDLTPYVGQSVQIRFQYITDGAVNEAGWAIDDIALPELGYAEDFETGAGGWESAGFVRTGVTLPQQFLLQQILLGDSGVAVVPVTLDATQQGTWTVPLSPDNREAVLIVSAITPVTRTPAAYQVAVVPIN